MNILDQILANKREEVARAMTLTPEAELRRQAAARGAPPDFKAALASKPLGLIAEIKRRSPSVGLIRDPFDPAAIARAYAEGGAQALSVLMDNKYFGGGAEDFQAVRAAVNLPLLYKEFVVDPWQVWHAAALGASAVLLIVGALSPDELKKMMGIIRDVGLQALVEVHDENEARIALAAGAEIIGINNRDLKTFVTTLETTGRVMKVIPGDRFIVSESGSRNGDDTRYVRSLGAGAVLVGEHLLRHENLADAVKNLMEPAWMSS
jgi:indole-3-glycerol phosphate synthase